MSDQVCMSWGCPSASPAPARSWQALPVHRHSVFALHRSSSHRGSDPRPGGPSAPPASCTAQGRAPPWGLHPALCHPAPSSLQHSVAVPPRRVTDRCTWPFGQCRAGLSCD